MGERRRPVGEAVADAATSGGAARRVEPRGHRGGRHSDPIGAELRRRDVLPLLVMHLIQRDATYGNELIGAIEEISQGVISVNPNTMYPLLRDLEARGLIAGAWEHPEKRTRRYYSITDAGRREYEQLIEQVEPFLDAVTRTVSLIKREVYE